MFHVADDMSELPTARSAIAERRKRGRSVSTFFLPARVLSFCTFAHGRTAHCRVILMKQVDMVCGCRYSMTTAIMRRECGGSRMQAPRHLLQDLHSTKAQTYAIEHEAGRDYGTPPFSLDFAKAKHAGILVRVL